LLNEARLLLRASLPHLPTRLPAHIDIKRHLRSQIFFQKHLLSFHSSDPIPISVHLIQHSSINPLSLQQHTIVQLQNEERSIPSRRLRPRRRCSCLGLRMEQRDNRLDYSHHRCLHNFLPRVHNLHSRHQDVHCYRFRDPYHHWYASVYHETRPNLLLT
jgi:hypothetical protein